MPEPARSLKQRKIDTLHRMENDKDLWIASSNAKGDPYLVPLSFWWDGTALFVATVLKNPTAQNIITTGKARIALGHTRDVILIDASATILESNEINECADNFTKKCGWDPRKAKGYRFFHLDPFHIEVWREENEHADRLLMKDGKWLV
jgi:hypothetical protein